MSRVEPQPLRRGSLVDRDAQAGVVGVLVQQHLADRYRPEGRLPGHLVRRGRRSGPGSDRPDPAFPRAGRQGRPAARRCGSCRTVSTNRTLESRPPSRTRASGKASGTRSAVSIAGPTSSIGVPPARCAATGAKMSRPWKVCETASRQSARFSRACAATMPPSRSAAGTSRPLSGPTKRSPRPDRSAIGAPIGADAGVDDGQVHADREVGDRRPEQEGRIPDAECATGVAQVVDPGVRAGSTRSRRGRPRAPCRSRSR